MKILTLSFRNLILVVSLSLCSVQASVSLEDLRGYFPEITQRVERMELDEEPSFELRHPWDVACECYNPKLGVSSVKMFLKRKDNVERVFTDPGFSRAVNMFGLDNSATWIDILPEKVIYAAPIDSCPEIQNDLLEKPGCFERLYKQLKNITQFFQPAERSLPSSPVGTHRPSDEAFKKAIMKITGIPIDVYQEQKIAFHPRFHHGSSFEEELVIRWYTGNGFEWINSKLRNHETMDQDSQVIMDMLFFAIQKIPATGGKFYRGSKDLPEEFKSQFKVGKIIHKLGFTSTSSNPNKIAQFGKEFKFVITGTNAHSVSYASEYQGEREYIFLPGTRFMVTGRHSEISSEHGKPQEIIELSELDQKSFFYNSELDEDFDIAERVKREDELRDSFPFYTNSLEPVKRLQENTRLVADSINRKLYIEKLGLPSQQLKSEDLLNRIYRVSGVPAPYSRIYYRFLNTAKAKDPVLLSQHIEGQALGDYLNNPSVTRAEKDKTLEKLRSNLVLDCLLGNSAVVGMDHIIVQKDGTPYRVGNRSDLFERGYSDSGKISPDLPKVTDALKKLTHPDLDSSNNPIVSQLTESELRTQVAKLSKEKELLLQDLPPPLALIVEGRIKDLEKAYPPLYED